MTANPTVFVNVDVDDIEAAVRFYTTALPLRLARRLGDDFVELAGANVLIYLLLKQAGTAPSPGATATRSYARHWTPVHLDFVVADIEAALSRAVSAGARLEDPISEHAYGRLAMLSDPFGHGFCLLELNAQGYGAIATS